MSIGSVALAAAKLEAERLSDNNEEGEGGNAEAVGPSDNCNSLPRMRSGCASRLSNAKKHSIRYSTVSSGIGDSPCDSLRTISSRVDLYNRQTSPPLVQNDEAFFDDEVDPQKSTKKYFERGSKMRRTKSTPDISEGDQILQRGAIKRDRLDKTQSVYYHADRQMTSVLEVREMTPEVSRRQFFKK